MSLSEEELDKHLSNLLNCLEQEESFKLKTFRALSKLFILKLVKERMNFHHPPTFE